MAAARRTAPDGYPSNYRAILDVLRFGFGLWGPVRMAVLLFHIERTTAYGWQSDQHSQSQAMEGIYSPHKREWTRAPAGVGLGTWKRENAALIEAGILHRERRKTRKNGDAPTEYAPDWPQIRKAIDKWKDEQLAKSPPLFGAPGPVPVWARGWASLGQGGGPVWATQ